MGDGLRLYHGWLQRTGFPRRHFPRRQYYEHCAFAGEHPQRTPGRSAVSFFLSIPGDGYEYEMAALARAARAGMPFKKLAIRTIYEADNASSHFSPLRDTIRIHRAMFAARAARVESHP